MKKVTVVCTHADRETAIDRLADLGVVHVVDVATPQSAELDALTSLHDRAKRAEAILSATPHAEHESDPGHHDAAGVVDRVLSLQDNIRLAEDEEYRWRNCLAQLEPWGSFSKESVHSIERAGYTVHLAASTRKAVPRELPEGALLQVISVHNKLVHYVLIVPEGEEIGEEFETVYLPEETNAENVKANIAACEARIAAAQEELGRLVIHRDRLESYVAEIDVKVGQVRAHDGMGREEHIAYLEGYVPAKRFAELEQAAQRHGWGLLDEDVEHEDDRVPTLLTVPQWLQISKPIFAFIGILPGYKEADVSASVLIFLSLFFGIIIGDAGYGVLFLGLGALLRWKVKDPRKKRPATLFLLMSAVTFVWGALSGNWFAIPAEVLPRAMQGIDQLTNADFKDQNVQWLCFFIAAVHLSMARLWQALMHLNSRQAAGHIGWAMLLWGNFFTAVELIVFPGTFPKFAFGLYGLGAGLILACGIKWSDVGDVLNLPFDFIGSFVDVLSYIRLFAVGLSSYFIAASFNNMGKMVYDLSPWLLIPAAIVILFGHLLNIALGFMGVLVHGIRLNTLEFSNHMGLSWSGRDYDPLRKVKPEAVAAETSSA